MNNGTEQVFVNSNDNQPTSTTQRLLEIPVSPQVNLENVHDFSNVCRTCATVTEFVIPIFEGEGLQNNLADKIRKHLPIRVTQQDVLPRVVCYQCASTLLAWHEMVACCEQADAALRSRLPMIPGAVDQDQKPSVSSSSQTINTLNILANLLPQRLANVGELAPVSTPPRYLGGAGADTRKICTFCGANVSLYDYRNHLVDLHSSLLFLCEECDSYVDRKDFILHMSLHAVQYANNTHVRRELPREPDRKPPLIQVKKDENENEAEPRLPAPPPPANTAAPTAAPTTAPTAVPTVAPTAAPIAAPTAAPIAAVRPANCGGNSPGEFSDHSDAGFQFEPLPDSVFEAIEDSRDSNAAGHSRDNQPAPAEIEPASADNLPSLAEKPRTRRNTAEKVAQTKQNKKNRTCPICSKTYKASSSFFYHMKHVHNKSQDHECDVCGKKFITKSNLTQHALIHSGEFRFPCEHCPKRFKARASLYIHEQIHKGTKRHECEQCGRAFRWRSHLTKHVQRHAADKRHACATCGRAFTVRCDLLRHARTHAAAALACPHCARTFAQQRYLSVHVRHKHADPTTPPTPRTPRTPRKQNNKRK